MNHYLTSFVERLESRYSKDALDMKNGEWMEKNTTLRGMPFSFSRYPFQRQIADDMHPNMDVIKPSQVGLALSVDTLVPTPTGWTTMGDLEVGDLVYDEQGRPTRVEYVSPIYIDHTCYEVEFDTGEVIVADAGHKWYVEVPTPRIVTTEEMARGLVCKIPNFLSGGYHRIRSVKRTPTVPVRCISVDSPNHLFLVGRGMIPTHNTEVQIRKALAICYRNTGISGIFTLPNLAMFKRLSQTRILPVVAGDKVFNSERDRDSVRSMGLIQIGKSFLYVTGASEGDATSISADFVMNDEVDLTNPAMLALFNSRLQGSDWRISQRFSTPTFPDYGIDLGYQSSDQHEYLAFCEACNHYQIPVFTRDFCHLPGLPDDIHDLTDIDEAILDLIDLEGCYVKCERCERPLDLSNHDKREWVPRRPNRIHHRGYRVRPFSTERLDIPYILTQLIRYKRRDYLRGFYNTVLGEPYADSNTRLDVAVIEACFTNQVRRPEISRDEPLFLGIDMGLTCHLVLSRGNYDVLTFETVPSDQIVDHVKAYCDIYNIVGGGVDRFPYTPTANEIFKVSEGKVWPVQYRGTKEIDVKQEEGYASADRTTAIDEVVLQIRRGVPRFSGYGTQRTTIIEHLRDMVRDEKPDEPARWLKTTGNDHYLHALALMMVGVKIRQFLDGKVKADPREVAAVVAVPTEENDTNLNLFGHRMRNSGLGFDRVW